MNESLDKIILLVLVVFINFSAVIYLFNDDKDNKKKIKTKSPCSNLHINSYGTFY